MEAVFSDEFARQKSRVKDGAMLARLQKAVEAVIRNPEKGKFLGRNLAGKKSVRITPFRLIFEPKANVVIFHTFDHRGKVYGKR